MVADPWPLSTAFLDARGDSRATSSAELEAALLAAWERGRAAWPDVALEADHFARQMATHVAADGDPIGTLSRIHGADLYLACASALALPSAVRHLDSSFLSRVPEFVGKLDTTGAFASEVAQALREKLLMPRPGGPPRIADYSGRAKLTSWLKVVALREALNLRRGQRPSEEPPEDIVGGPDPERDYLKLRYRGAYDEAFRAALSALDTGERLLLKLHYVDGLNIDQIGSMYQLHRSTVARRLASYRRKLLDFTRARLREQLNVTDSEFRSLLSLVRSQMTISLRTIFR